MMMRVQTEGDVVTTVHAARRRATAPVSASTGCEDIAHVVGRVLVQA